MTQVISRVAIMATLNISWPTFRKKDKKITEEVRQQHNASQDHGNYNKLLVEKSFIATMTSIVNAARAAHYSMTVPHNYSGAAILSTRIYEKYISVMNSFRDKFITEAETQVQGYLNQIEQAKIRLNGMFNQDDYPSVEKLKSMYDFSLSYKPIPEGGDIRADLSNEVLERIKAELASENDMILKQSQGILFKRLYDAVTHMANKLNDPESIFRDTLIKNIEELIDILPLMNLTQDQNLDTLVNEVRSKLVIWTPQKLRDDVGTRGTVASQAEEIANKLAQFLV
jgi:hypothetical protein